MAITQYFCTALFVLSACFPRGCLSIQCYQCGAQDGDATLSCDIFVKAPMWRQFEVECPTSPAHLCGKTITHYEDGSEPSEVRGCAPAENAFQVPNRMGCGRDDGTDQTVFCLCGTDLCNGANRLPALPSITFSFVFVLNFLILRTFLSS
ncbi:uncharacterized protein LOC116919097 [Daphnia magna]|uniref:Uncharacterized protein n=2 Tax=Daphnia magna TaxID=35525 RepID=A0ABR0AA03_9CRUS|nr:uncharacterized protein LOC116919097 [Daphnia magna]XP_045026381.1 uncharacterized protein LOC116919097 [Daphnia magna]XP_045026382.1 uncharacterized protein LOC116919097 [Daphnia magna]KAK4021961.1 hypothetical protein OUZ56_007448 [Daphnia magna]KZS08234.1 Uncharacterized protein APZ42_027856 [Daphnia magna]